VLETMPPLAGIAVFFQLFQNAPSGPVVTVSPISL